MRIGVDATSWSNMRGYGRFIRGLIPALISLASERHKFVLVVDRPSVGGFDFPPAAEVAIAETRIAPSVAAAHDGRRSIRDTLGLGRTSARLNLDAFFFPTVYTYFPTWIRGPIIVGFHDTIAETYPELLFPDGRGALLWRLKARLARAQADHVVTVSEHAKRLVTRRFRFSEDKVTVVGDAPDEGFVRLDRSDWDDQVLTRLGLTARDPYVAYLGGVNPHKNVPRLVEAMARVRQPEGEPPAKLVVVGNVESDVFTPGTAPVKEAISRTGLEERVIFTGFLSDRDVVHVLNRSRLLALPSLLEGFGLPAVEAAACGRPVVATEHSPLPQLLEGGGLFVDPFDVDSIATAISTLLCDAPLRERMGDEALRRAKLLSWNSSAKTLLDLIDRLLPQPGNGQSSA